MPAPIRSARALALAMFLLSPASAQVVGSVIDVLAPPISNLVTAGVHGSRIVVAYRGASTEAPRLELFEAAPGLIEYRRQEVISPPGWLQWWRVWHVALDDDLIAHHLYNAFGAAPELVIHDRTPAGWSSSSVTLPGIVSVRVGQLTAASGGRIATLSSAGTSQPFILNMVERGPSGSWGIAESVVISDIRSPHFDYQSFVALDGDVAAIGTASGSPAGKVAVLEPDALGHWRQTALFDPPDTCGWVVAGLALDGARLAVLRVELWDPEVGAVHIYGRQGSGTWAIEDRITVTYPMSAGLPGHIDFSGDRLAVTSLDGTTIYERSATGSMRAARRFTGLGSVISLDGDSVVGIDRRRVRLAAAPTNSGPLIVEAVASLAGQQTCPGTGTSRLRIHERAIAFHTRRAVAEVTDAVPGAAVILFRSPDPNTGTLPSGGLCIDRWTALPVGAPRTIGPGGDASFEILDFSWSIGGGLGAADHFQAVVFRAGLEWTNAIAWIS